MEKIKQWLEPNKNKWIASGVGVLVIVLAAFGTWMLTKPKQANYELVLKSSSPKIIMVEYGEPANEPKFGEYFELKRDGEVVTDMANFTFQNELIKSQEVTFKLTDEQLKVANEKSKDAIEFDDQQKKTIDEKAQRKIEVFEKETKLAESTLTVIVIDTKAPTIEPIEDIETEIGTPIEFTGKFKATDPVDGDVDVKVEGDVDYSVAGTTELKAVAVDKNGNKTQLPFNVVVKDKEAEATLPETGGNGNASSNGGGSSNGGSSNGGSSSGGGYAGNGNSSGGGSSNGGGSTPQPEKPKPVEPTRPTYVQGQDLGGGNYFYKDYGNYESCSAVVRSEGANHVREWSSNMCDEIGIMTYTKR